MEEDATRRLAAVRLSAEDQGGDGVAVDLRALLKSADDAVIDAARTALALVAARGCHRGRDLGRDLERALRDLGRSGG